MPKNILRRTTSLAGHTNSAIITAGPRTAIEMLGAAARQQHVSEAASNEDTPSAHRAYYDSFYDRDQLARAIAVNGDWDDPEISDLVRRAATSLTADGYHLRCMIDDEMDPEPQRASRPSVASHSPQRLASAPSMASSNPGNPFRHCAANRGAAPLTLTAGVSDKTIFGEDQMAYELAAATQSISVPESGRSEQAAASAIVDFSNPVAVYAEICRVNPFGEILCFDGIIDACADGRGEALLRLSTPGEVPIFDEVAIDEIMPTVDWIASITCLQTRAEMICRTRFFGTCPVSRALIAEVADAGPLGVLAQAYLQAPVKTRSDRVDGRRAQARHRKRA